MGIIGFVWNDYLHCRIHTGLFICIIGLGLGISIPLTQSRINEIGLQDTYSSYLVYGTEGIVPV
jgi:hypothetical protein